ncbi:MAG: phage portal protein family protein, partial [Candidatus Sumerlaeota bacterium]
DDRDRRFEVVESLQQDTGVTIPESMTLELLEARRSGNATTYESLAEWCNAEISKIVLGATLTSGEGRAHGTQALGKVHERVRSDYVSADARMLEGVVNGQLIRWMVDFNFGPQAAAPHWQIDTSREDAMEREIALDRELMAAGVPLPVDYFYEKYGRPAPAEGESALRFDDQNLFQYHLRYGVLTVNEARARLGLGPVAWGNEPTRPVEWPDDAARRAGPSEERGDPVESELEREPEDEPREL